MNRVDREVYKPFQRYGNLGHSFYFEDTRFKPTRLDNLPQIASDLGFAQAGELPTKKAVWHIFDRANHDVPNFSVGATRISSTLAVYESGEHLTHALLRTSEEPHHREEFVRDLTNFTKHFIERPRLLGFPSRWSTDFKGLGVALAVGSIALSAADYYTIQTLPGSVINVGTLVGEGGAPLVYAAIWRLGDIHARRSISHPNEYTTGDTVRSVLLEERYHTVKVDIQEELYEALKQEGIDLTPDNFLGKIYDQIPPALVQKRHAELEHERYPMLEPDRKLRNSLPTLVHASQVLRQAEDLLSQASKLKASLAQ